LREAQIWRAYEFKRGELNPFIRSDFNTGQLLAFHANMNRKPGSRQFVAEDFSRYEDEPLKEQPISLTDAMRTWH